MVLKPNLASPSPTLARNPKPNETRSPKKLSPFQLYLVDWYCLIVFVALICRYFRLL